MRPLQSALRRFHSVEQFDGDVAHFDVAPLRFVHQSGERFAGLDVRALTVGLWSRVASEATVLREGDRVELYRGLKADPKDARRARARLKPSTRSRSGP